MALWVSPPPQGFSQARCSSKIFTECPARASCSPHIDPDGPPPTIAISAMRSTRFLPDPSPSSKPLCDGEDRQGEGREEYSTEYRGGRWRACSESYCIGRQPLHKGKHDEIGREQHEQDLPGVQEEDAREER